MGFPPGDPKSSRTQVKLAAGPIWRVTEVAEMVPHRALGAVVEATSHLQGMGSAGAMSGCGIMSGRRLSLPLGAEQPVSLSRPSQTALSLASGHAGTVRQGLDLTGPSALKEPHGLENGQTMFCSMQVGILVLPVAQGKAADQLGSIPSILTPQHTVT